MILFFFASRDYFFSCLFGNEHVKIDLDLIYSGLDGALREFFGLCC